MTALRPIVISNIERRWAVSATTKNDRKP